MGAFDDLIPEKAPSAKEGSGGTFDDLIPPSREKELRAQYLKDQLASGEPGYSQRLKDSATLGLMRPLGGLMRGVSGVADPTSTFGERYRAGVGAEEDYAKRAVENTNPILGAATDIAGGVGSMGSAGRATLGKLIGQGAGIGAVEGAARNAEDPASAAKGAATGGAIGAGTSAVVGGLANRLGNVQGAQKAAREASRGETPQELRDVAKSYYKQLDNSGIAYGQPQTATLKQGLDDLVTSNQYNPVAHQKISDYVNQLDKLAQAPQGATFSQLHNIRSALAKEARGSDASTREAAGKVVGEIDKMVQGSAPVVNPNNVDIKKIYPDASKTWRAAALADDVDWAASKAERAASSKAGVNPDEANRGAFRAIENKVSKPGAYDPYTLEQRALLSKIVQGDKLQNTYRNVGAVADSPITKALVGVGAGAAGLHGGGLEAGLLAGGAGRLGSEAGGMLTKGLNRAAASRGADNIDTLIRNITTGSSAPSNRLPSREALAILMAKQRAQRGGAAYGGSLTGE